MCARFHWWVVVFIQGWSVVVLVVVMCWWYGCHVTHGNMASAIQCEGEKGRGTQ